ncbi:MAG: MlaD family protein [Planctomycetota bacterium]|jgi:hypothetical protein
MADEKPQTSSKEQVGKRKIRARKLNAIVGFITAAAVAILLWFTITVTDATFIKSGYWIKVRFDEIIGLQEGDLVVYSGMVAGKVKYIDLVTENVAGDNKARIELTCFIEDKVRRDAYGKERKLPVEIHKDSYFDIRSSSLLGGVAVVIERGPGKADYIRQERNNYFEAECVEGASPISLVKEIQVMAKEIKDVIAESGPEIIGTVKNINNLTGNAADYMKQVNEGPGMLHDLAHPSETYDKIKGTVDAFYRFSSRLAEKVSIIDNIDRTAENFAKITDDFASGEGLLPYLVSVKSKPLVGKVSSIIDNVDRFSAHLAADNGFIAKIQGPEGEALFHDISKIVARLSKYADTMDNSSIGMLLSDDGKLYKDVADFAESLRLLGRQVTGRGMAKEEMNSIARLLTDKGKLYEDAKVGVESLRKFMEPLARLETNVIVGYHEYNGQELGVAKIGLKLIPRRSRYFYVGGSIMRPDRNGPVSFDIDDQEDGKDIIFIDLLVAQHIPIHKIDGKDSDWRNLILTAKAGLIEGKAGGGLDLDFLKDFRLSVEGRQAHTDSNDFHENIDGDTLLRAELSYTFAKYFRIHVGADNLLDDPDWSAGFSIEWKDDDIRALVSVAGASQ